MSKRLLTSVLVFGFAMIACAGRTPSISKSTGLLRRHFVQYGKKYETSSFGKGKVANVEILGTEEVHKHLVAFQAFVTLDNADVHKVRVTVEKGPFGWRVLAWENLDSVSDNSH